MAKENKARRFRLTLVNNDTHKHLWMLHFQRSGLLLTILSVILVFLLAAFCLIAFTPLKTFIPGYPDATVQRAAIRNAMTVDSLEHIVDRWEFYAESLRRIVEGEDPVRIDSLVRAQAARPMDAAEKARLDARDSVLRQQVMEAEQFGLDSRTRKLPIEGMHFFPPLKGVVSQAYDPTLHPAVDITAPANSVVMAALDGTVIYAGWMGGYGNAVMIDHGGGLVTLYGHNSSLTVGVGENVARGQTIALAGSTGNSTGPHCHFEVRVHGDVVEPLNYLP